MTTTISSPEEIKKVKDEITCLKQENENHRAKANKSHAYYVEVTKCCSVEWDKFTTLEQKQALSEEENVILERPKKRFSLVLSAYMHKILQIEREYKDQSS